MTENTKKPASSDLFYTYDAFISYSHAADGRLAPALQKALERIAKPLFKRSALRIFRDQTDLAATPHLWGNIEEALSKSRFLILLSSPDSARSDWVKKEVDYWLKNKAPESILIALTDGEISWDKQKNDFDWERTNAVPETLAGQFAMQPLFVDLREARTADDLSLQNTSFKQKAAALGATIHGLPLRDIIGEDVRILRQTIRLRNSAISLLLFLLLGVFWFAWQAKQSAAEAIRNGEEAIEQGEIAIIRGDSLAVQLSVSDSLRIVAEQERQRAEEERRKTEKALLSAYQNQIGIHERDRAKALNRIDLAIQAGRPQDTRVYHAEAEKLRQQIEFLEMEIANLNRR